MRPNSIRNSMKNRYQKHARKKKAQIWKLIKKVIQKWSQNPSKITPKIDAKKETKKEDLKHCRPRSAEVAGSPNPIISKDILRSEVRRKYTKKAEWGVSTRWSAKSEVQKGKVKKGKCRKTSADRQPTSHLNTLGGYDHVRIQVAKQVRTVPVRGCDAEKVLVLRSVI